MAYCGIRIIKSARVARICTRGVGFGATGAVAVAGFRRRRTTQQIAS
jgi:hypothetical protein